ncbi:right-handed parallel beta-helix repeat-containing protein [Domibacillus sp. DTU_2020_1001157_1_SI_ALB_TIR_016]|uniref:right-handed parallel beta-helix repeat-containing protein n=1 Tax=Domibacillus sp. DTU_2020_1001157_1_SI_ALB_TIR_016 TaxID=3077789 RepID=UPI0028EDDA57|nr:right-handed parallel beta-helix repeat-containing protein [Domibacillus sp. DTU_2020_1001157_1_SI_ALB_TIR_016]WNS81354.1 right-handed parallel beta-helix repeat-containing protein [Domibacillus sp. DTU_2020_1001157_1_SI_ALB_TIR_016]
MCSRAENNIIRSNKEGGAFFNSAHGHTLYGNKISCNGGHLSKPYLSSEVLIRGGENSVISANDISQNAERGVYALDHVNGNETIHNTITDNGHIAIETNDGNGLVIKNTHVSGTHDAVIIHNSSSSVVSNNGSSVSSVPPAEEPVRLPIRLLRKRKKSRKNRST